MRADRQLRVLAIAVRAAIRGLGPQPRHHRLRLHRPRPMPVQLDGEVIDAVRRRAVTVTSRPERWRRSYEKPAAEPEKKRGGKKKKKKKKKGEERRGYERQDGRRGPGDDGRARGGVRHAGGIGRGGQQHQRGADRGPELRAGVDDAGTEAGPQRLVDVRAQRGRRDGGQPQPSPRRPPCPPPRGRRWTARAAARRCLVPMSVEPGLAATRSRGAPHDQPGRRRPSPAMTDAAERQQRGPRPPAACGPAWTAGRALSAWRRRWSSRC